MTKKYASHYLFIEDKGYFKLAAIEIIDGTPQKITFISQETENTEWLPGIIILVPKSNNNLSRNFIKTCKGYIENAPSQISESVSIDIDKNKEYIAVYFPFFNFTEMKLVDETQHRLLQ